MASRHYNPERRAWRGRSYRKGGVRVRHLRANQSDEEREMPKYRLTEEAKKTDLKITRALHHHGAGGDGHAGSVDRQHHLSETGNGPMQGPVGAVEMAADMLDALTNRCQKSDDGEHVYDVETVMQTLDYESPSLEDMIDTEELAIGCSLCGTQQRKSDF